MELDGKIPADTFTGSLFVAINFYRKIVCGRLVMAITSNGSAANATGANPVAVDPAASANDVIIAAVITDAAGSTVDGLASGFSQEALQSCTADGQTICVAVKGTASGSEGSISPIDMSANAVIVTANFSGAKNATPLNLAVDVVNQDTASASPLVIDSNSLTPTADGCMIVAIIGVDVTVVGVDSTTTFSTLSGTTGAWTKLQDIYDSNFNNLAIGYAFQTTAGAIVVRSSSTSTQSMGGTLVTLVLQPSGPTVTVQPTNQTVFITQTATFTLTATGAGTLHYQWKFDGGNVGTDSDTYARTNCALADNAKDVYCVVTDDNGSTNSEVVKLYVNNATQTYYNKA